MSNDEIFEWVALLGRSRQKRIAAIENLLANAEQDEMSSEDRETCERALALMGVKQ